MRFSRLMTLFLLVMGSVFFIFAPGLASDELEWDVFTDERVSFIIPVLFNVTEPEVVGNSITYGITSSEDPDKHHVLRIDPSIGILDEQRVKILKNDYEKEPDVIDTDTYEISGKTGFIIHRKSMILNREYETSEYFYDDGTHLYSLVFTYDPELSDKYRYLSLEMAKSIKSAESSNEMAEDDTDATDGCGLDVMVYTKDGNLITEGTAGCNKSGDELSLWIISERGLSVDKIPVTSDGSFLYKIDKDTLPVTPYYVVVIQPGTDGVTAIYPDNPLSTQMVYYSLNGKQIPLFSWKENNNTSPADIVQLFVNAITDNNLDDYMAYTEIFPDSNKEANASTCLGDDQFEKKYCSL